MSVSVEKDELFRGELRKHPLWIWFSSQCCINGDRMVIKKYRCGVDGCWWMSREMKRRKKKKKASVGRLRHVISERMAVRILSRANHRRAAATGLAMLNQSRGVTHSTHGDTDWTISPSGHTSRYFEEHFKLNRTP